MSLNSALTCLESLSETLRNGVASLIFYITTIARHTISRRSWSKDEEPYSYAPRSRSAHIRQGIRRSLGHIPPYFYNPLGSTLVRPFISIANIKKYNSMKTQLFFQRGIFDLLSWLTWEWSCGGHYQARERTSVFEVRDSSCRGMTCASLV